MRSPVDVVTPLLLLNPTPPALLLHAYRIRLRTTGPVHLAAFPGPVLRGALGDDPAVYAALFHPPPLLPQRRFADPPRPVTLRPRFGAGEYGAGSVLELDVTLVGAAAGALPAEIRALARLGERGVGPSRHEPGGGRFELERVDAVGPGGTEAVVEPDGRVRPATLPWRFPDDFAAAPPGALVLELCTPTFVRRGGDARGTLAFRDLVGDLLSRVSLLGQAYGDGAPFSRETERELLAAAEGVALADAAVRWLEVPRYSRTQRSPMSFGGWMGWVRYDAETAAWGALLRAAELLHVGKHAAFGFGWVRLAERAAG